MGQPNDVHIMQEQWDYLIILDACRYDYFKKFWKEHLPEGQLSCRTSVGSTTWEWRDNSFPGFYENVIYVSSNPFINSFKSVLGFSGKEHFHAIIDAWVSGWDGASGTVRPETITKEALQAISNFSNKKLIIHYLQPHAPYLKFGSDCAGFPFPTTHNEPALKGINDYSKYPIRKKLFQVLLSCYKMIYKNQLTAPWYLAQILGLPPQTPMDAVRRKYGDNGLQKAYSENLQAVLGEVSILLKYLKGTIVVTSDHGELLGENKMYSHHTGSQNSILRNIPWFVLTKKEAETISIQFAPQPKTQNEVSAAIEKRLRDLGYL